MPLSEFRIIGLMNGTAAKLQEIKPDSALGEYVSNMHTKYKFIVIQSIF